MSASVREAGSGRRGSRVWLVAVAAVVGLQVTAPPASAAAPVKVMPLGDSITDGDDIPGGYRIELEDLLLEGGHSFDFVGSMQNGWGSLFDVDHEGHGGWRIDQITAKVETWLATEQPDVVLLKIGTNDVLQSYDMANAPRRLSELLDRIATAAPSASILVSTITPLADTRQNDKVRTFNAALPAIVNDKVGAGSDVELVDNYAALTTDDLLDGTHPDAGGYGKMATVWYSALGGVLPAPK